MGNDRDDVDPENPRPEGHYPRFKGNTWHYVPDDLAQTISLGPAGDGEPGQDWVLSYTPERENTEDREKVFVRLTPRALQELYIETKDLSVDARMHGHRAECDLCGDMVDLEKAIPNKREEPVHRRCYKDAYGGPVWLE
ncbi:hypothetical protein [Natrialba sp. INN-245]|uniref:hypothetical protein n=1 Tax=Natrialba sp. INN-245 TaxID=2690967 RepID=UPI001312A70A|nr:hypothetical protein [Natrialba sp. INN-245]MWV40121.1 hypothetical protein [Natrialba sp. INN-245]